MDYYQASGELVLSIPITTGSPYNKYVLYSVLIDSLESGNILSTTTEFEATNNYNYNVMIGSMIVLSNSTTGTSGILINEANGFNITPGMHHGVVNHARQIKISSNYLSYYLNTIIWGASTSANPSDNLIIQKGYGHLDAIVFN